MWRRHLDISRSAHLPDADRWLSSVSRYCEIQQCSSSSFLTSYACLFFSTCPHIYLPLYLYLHLHLLCLPTCLYLLLHHYPPFYLAPPLPVSPLTASPLAVCPPQLVSPCIHLSTSMRLTIYTYICLFTCLPLPASPTLFPFSSPLFYYAFLFSPSLLSLLSLHNFFLHYMLLSLFLPPPFHPLSSFPSPSITFLIIMNLGIWSIKCYIKPVLYPLPLPAVLLHILMYYHDL